MIKENAGNVPEVPVESVRCDKVLMPEMGIKFHRIFRNGISKDSRREVTAVKLNSGFTVVVVLRNHSHVRN